MNLNFLKAINLSKIVSTTNKTLNVNGLGSSYCGFTNLPLNKSQKRKKVQ